MTKVTSTPPDPNSRYAHRHGFHVGQDVVSTAAVDMVEPRGYIFAFRPKSERSMDMARVVFRDNAIRDVSLDQLLPAISER